MPRQKRKTKPVGVRLEMSTYREYQRRARLFNRGISQHLAEVLETHAKGQFLCDKPADEPCKVPHPPVDGTQVQVRP